MIQQMLRERKQQEREMSVWEDAVRAVEVREVITSQGADALLDAMRAAADARAANWLRAMFRHQIAQEVLAEIERLGASSDEVLVNAKAEYDRLITERDAAVERRCDFDKRLESVRANRPNLGNTDKSWLEDQAKMREWRDEQARLEGESRSANSDYAQSCDWIERAQWRRLEAVVAALRDIPRPAVPSFLLSEVSHGKEK